MIKRAVLITFAVLLGGCITFTAVVPGETSVSGLSLKTATTWNQAPREMTRLSRPESRTWTQNGILLDRILIIPAVPDGQPIFRQYSQSQALPLFKQDMLPNEISELVESSIVKLFGEGGATVTTSALRPQSFGRHGGVMFDLFVSVSDGPDYRGVTGALIVDSKLYLIVYLAAEPYYYEKLLDEAVRIIQSSRVEVST